MGMSGDETGCQGFLFPLEYPVGRTLDRTSYLDNLRSFDIDIGRLALPQGPFD